MSVIAPLSPPDRARVTKEVSDRFRGKPLDFKAGVSCVHLLREQMLAFGYSPRPIPAFEDVKGARKALRSVHHRTLRGLLDEMLERIPPATMRVGDIVLAPGHPFEAVCVNAGGGKFLGWQDDGHLGLVNIIVDPGALIGAWRLI